MTRTAQAAVETSAPAGCAAMPDDELIERFESATLPPGGFHHADHVRLAWLLHRRYSPAETLSRLASGLRRVAAAAGAPEHYHETITWSWSALVRERIERLTEEGRDAATWERFAAENPDLFDPEDPILRRYYRAETLSSPLARRVFVLPDS